MAYIQAVGDYNDAYVAKAPKNLRQLGGTINGSNVK